MTKRVTLLVSMVVALLVVGAVGIAVAAGAPSASTNPATNVGSTTATLNGTVFPNQQDTTYHFEYGIDTNYGTQTPTSDPIGGNAGKDVSADVTGLQPSTTYHYRVVATNATDTSQGSDVTFTTLGGGAQPPPGGGNPPPANTITIKASPTTITFGNGSAITGQVTGANNGAQTVTIEQNPYPFTGGFKPAGTAVTDSTGNYLLAVKPLVNTRYRATLKGNGAVSPEVLVNVRVKVGLRLSDSTPRRGQLVRFSGLVLPAHNAKIALIQKRTATGSWRTVARATLVATTPVGGVQRSKYSKRLRIRTSGSYRTVVKPADGDHATGTSARRRARVH